MYEINMDNNQQINEADAKRKAKIYVDNRHGKKTAKFQDRRTSSRTTTKVE